jgi:hypothetical protein
MFLFLLFHTVYDMFRGNVKLNVVVKSQNAHI